MDVVQHRGGGGGGSSSGLNPNAPLFVPRAYKAVDGSSDQWWQLVESSSWFRDYWFRQRQQQEQRRKEEEEEDELRRGSDDVLLPDVDALFHGYQPKEEKRHIRDLAALEGGRWNVPYNKVEDKWYAEKMVHMSDLRVNPWVFQQPK